jgi:hypothetical protein
MTYRWSIFTAILDPVRGSEQADIVRDTGYRFFDNGLLSCYTLFWSRGERLPWRDGRVVYGGGLENR